jgi:DNA primase catalytic subunit
MSRNLKKELAELVADQSLGAAADVAQKIMEMSSNGNHSPVAVMLGCAQMAAIAATDMGKANLDEEAKERIEGLLELATTAGIAMAIMATKEAGHPVSIEGVPNLSEPGH